MKTVLMADIVDVLPIEDGMVIAFLASKEGNKALIEYKMVTFDDGVITSVGKSIYPLTKFGAMYNAFKMQVDNIYTCSAIILPSGKLLVSEREGEAKLLDEDASLLWQGDIRYNGETPAKICIFDNKIWACYTDNNVVIRYNINTMREELRVGGSQTGTFSAPEDIIVYNGEAYISNSGTKQILKMNIRTYEIGVYAEFNEKVHKYMKISGYEFAVLDSGVYMLD